jgi:hypothetical protein
MNLRLSADARSVYETGTYRTTIGRLLQAFDAKGQALRVSPGNPEKSGLLLRMQQRGSDTQMPPLGTEHVDHAGVALIRRWIEALPASGG